MILEILVSFVVAASDEPRYPTDSEKEVIRDVIGSGLKDPFSAQYAWPRINEVAEGATYCPQVNAKNSFGAYSGYEPRVLVLEVKEGTVTRAFDVEALMGRDSSPESLSKVCSSSGYDPDAPMEKD